MKGLLELIKLLYGPRALSKTIGTRTNVIRLPNKEMKRYIKEELNIEAASDKLAQKAYKEMQELIPEIPKMNDAERLIFEGNLRRLKSKLNIRSAEDPTAEVIEFGTKQKVSPKGIETLVEQAGQKSPPGTIMGNLESRLNKLRASGKELEDIVKDMRPKTTEDYYAETRRAIENPTPEEAAIRAKEKSRLSKVFDDAMNMQKSMSRMQDEGLVRAAVRYKMMDDLKRGTLKLPKNLEDVVRGASNEEDVITVFRTNYGEDALEQVDSLIPDFYNMSSATEAVKTIEQKFPNMKPRKIEVKQVMDLDEAAKAEQENVLTPKKKPEEPEEFAIGGRVGYQKGTPAIFDQLEMDVPYPHGQQVENSSKGLDYLTGIERRGYADGLGLTAQQSSMISDMSKRGMDVDTISAVTGVSTQEVQDAINNQNNAPAQANQITPGQVGNVIGRVSDFFSNPVVQGIGAFLTGGTSALANYAKGQVGGYLAGKVLSPYVQNTMNTSGGYSGPFGGYNDFDGTEGTFSTDTSDTGASGGFDSAAEDSDQSGGDAGSTSGTDSAGDGGDGYAIGGRVGFRFGSKKPKDLVKIVKKIWNEIFPSGDKKYDAQVVADELAERIYKKPIDELPQKVQIDLYGVAYDNNPNIKPMFKLPENFEEAMQKGMDRSREMESLGLDVTKSDDFFKYEDMMLSGKLGPERQADAYKQKIRDEFSGVIDENLMQKVEVDDDPQRLAEVYASIKEGLEMQKRGMSPEEIVDVMKKTPRTKNANGGLNYLMGY